MSPQGLLFSCPSPCPETPPWGLWCGQLCAGQVPSERRHVELLRPPLLLSGLVPPEGRGQQRLMFPQCQEGSSCGQHVHVSVQSVSAGFLSVYSPQHLCSAWGGVGGGSMFSSVRSDTALSLGPNPCTVPQTSANP